MKTSFIIALLLITICSTSQIHYPKGCYMTVEELKAKSPSKNYELVIEKRTTSDIKMNGGNDYKLISPDKSVKRKVLKKEIIAYSTGDSLYINCLPFKLQKWYSTITCEGKYFVFSAGISMDKALHSKEMQLGTAFGAVGGAFAGASLALNRYLYILDIDSNKIHLVNDDLIRSLLEEDPDLLEKFNKWSTKSDHVSQIYYLKLINSRYLKQTGANKGYTP